jgi:general stress protein 26
MAKPSTPIESSESKQHFFEVLADFDTAMLVTRPADDSLHGRPLSIAGREPDGTLWFMTSVQSPKVAEIVADQRSLVTLQSSNRFVALEGTAQIVGDPEKIRELWSPAQRIWFESENDPDIVLIRFSPKEAEYWDNAGAQGIRFAFAAAKAVLMREPLTDRGDPKAHGKVGL